MAFPKIGNGSQKNELENSGEWGFSKIIKFIRFKFIHLKKEESFKL